MTTEAVQACAPADLPRTDTPAQETHALVSKPLEPFPGIDGSLIWWQPVQVVDFYPEGA
jgi:hypothetical protein